MKTKSPRKPWSKPRYERMAAIYVIEAYNSCRSVNGMEQAIDYSQRNPGSQGPQYRDDSRKYFQLIDFIADVESALKAVLTPAEMEYFTLNLLDVPEIDLTVQSEAFLEMQQKMGKLFIERELFPITKYFRVIKR